ncbi:MAG TPA: tetratricopeptide repeat protein [Allosphingosinicella sp.]
MAVKPKDSDTFLREVDEELRRERVGNFMTRYGWYMVALAALLLAAIGGWIWWQHRQNVAAGEASTKVIQVQDQLQQNNAKGAAPTIDELAGNSRVGYRMAALFSRAQAQISTNAVPAAIETFKAIVADPEAPQPYKDAALIRQTQLEMDNLQPGQLIQRLQPFVQAGNPWHGTAGEMVGIALIKAQRLEQAGRVFEGIARDQSVPETIRARAIQIASSLGIDAVQLDPSMSGAVTVGGGGGAPAATPQPAAPAPQGQAGPPAAPQAPAQ